MSDYNPKELSPLHQRELRLLSEGLRVKDVARIVGRSESHVTHIKRSAKGRAYLDKLAEERQYAMTKGALALSLVRAGLLRG